MIRNVQNVKTKINKKNKKNNNNKTTNKQSFTNLKKHFDLSLIMNFRKLSRQLLR